MNRPIKRRRGRLKEFVVAQLVEYHALAILNDPAHLRRPDPAGETPFDTRVMLGYLVDWVIEARTRPAGGGSSAGTQSHDFMYWLALSVRPAVSGLSHDITEARETDEFRRAYHVHRTNVYKSVARLEAEGVLRRERESPERVYVALTRRGFEEHYLAIA